MGISASVWMMVMIGGLGLAAVVIVLQGMTRPRREAGESIRRVPGREVVVQSFYRDGAMSRAASTMADTGGAPDPELATAAQMTSGAVGTTVASIALDTASVGLDPDDRRLRPCLTELEDVRRPAALSDLFSPDGASPATGLSDDVLFESRRAVIRAYRSSGRGACLVVPVTGHPGRYFDFRIERYSGDLAGVCEEVFSILRDLVEWSAGEGAGATTPVALGDLASRAPMLLRALQVAVRDLELPPSVDYIRAEIDAYAGALGGRFDPRAALGVIERFGRLDLGALGITAEARPSGRLVHLAVLIAVWDALILNFGFCEEVG